MFNKADKEDLATQTAALTAKVAQSQPNAGTLVKGAFMKLAPAGRGKSPLDALADLAAMDDESIKEQFGESEPLQIMAQLFRDDRKGFESIAQLTEKAMIETGTENDYLGNKVNFFDKANPNLVAMRNATREEQARNISAENSAGTAATNKAVYNRVIKNLNKSETIPDFAKPPLQVLMGGIAYMGDMWNFEIAGNKEASINRGREEWLRAQVNAARNGTPIPEGQIPGLSASEQARHNESLDVLKRILSAAERPPMQAPTIPTDDR